MSEFFSGLVGFFYRSPSLVLWDVADIVLVAFVFYYVLLVMRGTRAMQMGVGLVFVFLVYQIAKRFGLVTLYAMLDGLLTSLVLIIVVVFQHDIRRALMRFGRRPFFPSARAALEGQMVEDTVKAVHLLAQKRIGALIVFERDAMLDEFVEHGTVLDAAVSRELLYSLFIPSYENPLHDGAAVIRDGRLWQAGCFLPLSASTRLERSLGTRHRAAIGLTEETDAVVIVVSEERGAMSLCFNGNIVRNLDAASLRKALRGLLHKRPDRKKAKGRDSRSSIVPLGERAIEGIRPSQPPPVPKTEEA